MGEADVRPEFGADERRLMAHEAGDEVNVAGQPLEFRDRDWRSLAVTPRLGQRGDELRPTFERVRAFARLDLDELAGDREPLRLSESDELRKAPFHVSPLKGDGTERAVRTNGVRASRGGFVEAPKQSVLFDVAFSMWVFAPRRPVFVS